MKLQSWMQCMDWRRIGSADEEAKAPMTCHFFSLPTNNQFDGFIHYILVQISTSRMFDVVLGDWIPRIVSRRE